MKVVSIENDQLSCLLKMMDSFTTPIIVETKNRETITIGSGVYFSHKEKFYIVTAAHIIKEINSGKYTRMKEYVRDGDILTSLPVINKTFHKNSDIGLIEIEKCIRSCEISMVFNPISWEVDMFLSGFPSVAQTKLQPPGNFWVTLSMQMLRFEKNESDYYGEGYKGPLITTSVNDTILGHSTPFKNNPDPHGFSGGPIWMIQGSEPEKIFNPYQNLKLIGIQSHWREKSNKYLIVPINELLEFLS